jgi:hypothetical protein
MNRGIAKGPLFSSEQGARYFLSRLAREVHRGEIEVLSYSLLTTHFHALVISRRGNVGLAMQRIEAPYVQRFNLRHGRDGGLVRGRFESRRVRSNTYRETLIAYIDRNPAAAGIVPHGGAYPFGSAIHYLRPKGPVWLSREWVENWVRSKTPSGRYSPDAYLQRFSRGVSEARLRWIEEQIRTGALDSPVVDRFLRNLPGRVLRQLRARARLADGHDRPTMVVDPQSVEEVVEREEKSAGPLSLRSGRAVSNGWPVLRVGLLRDLCGLVFAEIAGRVRSPRTSAYRLYELHQRAVQVDGPYAVAVERVAGSVLRACHGPP